MTDPFSNAPVNETEQNMTENKETFTIDTPAAQAMTDQNYTTAILKGGDKYGAPSVSIRGAGITDLREHYESNRESLRELMKMLAQDSAGYATAVDQSLNKGKASAPQNSGNSDQAPQQQSNGKPAGANQAPNGETHTCKCGDEMKFISGFSQKTQKPYAFFACPKPQNSQCEGNNGRSYTVNYKG